MRGYGGGRYEQRLFTASSREQEREKEEVRRALTAAVAQLAAEKEEAEERAALAEAALAEAATLGPTPRRSSEATPHRTPHLGL